MELARASTWAGLAATRPASRPAAARSAAEVFMVDAEARQPVDGKTQSRVESTEEPRRPEGGRTGERRREEKLERANERLAPRKRERRPEKED